MFLYVGQVCQQVVVVVISQCNGLGQIVVCYGIGDLVGVSWFIVQFVVDIGQCGDGIGEVDQYGQYGEVENDVLQVFNVCVYIVVLCIGDFLQGCDIFQ